MNRLIVGNWKHNPVTLSGAMALAEGVAKIEAPEGVELIACPPYPYLAAIAAAHPKLKLGSQDVSALPPGAFTGEVGAALLKDLGVQYAIIGHSERRAIGDSDDDVTAKVLAASAEGITPIVCVGEERDVKELGVDAVRAFLQNQLSAIPEGPEVIVAYEPIWAIGTGLACDPETAVSTARWIAEYLGLLDIKVRVLYGGSANPENASDYLKDPAIAGLLVGGASLDAEKFTAIAYAR